MFNCKLALAPLTPQPRSGFWRNKGYESALFQLLHLKRSPNPSTACFSLLNFNVTLLILLRLLVHIH